MVTESRFYQAWARLLFAYLVSFALSFAAGIFLILILRVTPETIFEVSTRRISFVFPVLESGASYGVDVGVLLFTWNTLGALATISFLYSAPLFNPHTIALFPQTIRRIFSGRKRMKLLCFLPGCLQIEEESLRRVYVWLMVPWLGMILLGIESGLTASTSSALFGSYLIGFASLLPHGIIEIPTISFAGAIPFAAHLLVKKRTRANQTDAIFKDIADYTKTVPLVQYIVIVISGLFIAGLVEGHITPEILRVLRK